MLVFETVFVFVFGVFALRLYLYLVSSPCVCVCSRHHVSFIEKVFCSLEVQERPLSESQVITVGLSVIGVTLKVMIS